MTSRGRLLVSLSQEKSNYGAQSFEEARNPNRSSVAGPEARPSAPNQLEREIFQIPQGIPRKRAIPRRAHLSQLKKTMPGDFFSAPIIEHGRVPIRVASAEGDKVPLFEDGPTAQIQAEMQNRHVIQQQTTSTPPEVIRAHLGATKDLPTKRPTQTPGGRQPKQFRIETENVQSKTSFIQNWISTIEAAVPISQAFESHVDWETSHMDDNIESVSQQENQNPILLAQSGIPLASSTPYAAEKRAPQGPQFKTLVMNRPSIDKQLAISGELPNAVSCQDPTPKAQAVALQVSDKGHPSQKYARFRSSKRRSFAKMRNSQRQILPPCKCRKKCQTKITDAERKTINKQFWANHFGARRMFFARFLVVTHCSKGTHPQRQLLNKYNRQCHVAYHLPLFNGEPVSVCRTMFLRTLGLKSDGMLTAFRRRLRAQTGELFKDHRGGNHGRNRGVKETIRHHIFHFHPMQSHYTRMHAPRRRYLSKSLCIRKIWKGLTQTGFDVSYGTFQRVFHSERISFGYPKPDLCEICIQGQNHIKEVGLLHGPCTLCTDVATHKVCAAIARQKYVEDIKSRANPELGLFAVDLQRVILLHIMRAKSCFFARRLQTFNETFASMTGGKDSCVVWHEALTGRTGGDIAPAFACFIFEHSDTFTDFVYWTDNCIAQNKNWVLFSALLQLVNMPMSPSSITIRFLEKGHTFMRADSVHGLIGQRIARLGEIHTFEDFKNAVSQSKSNIQCLPLDRTQIRQWKSLRTPTEGAPKLAKIREVKFIAGDLRMHYKLRLDASLYNTCKFHNLTSMPPIPLPVLRVSGIEGTKRAEILSTLVPLMPRSKHSFWSDLPISPDTS